jgi:hypothetical protein
MWIGNLGDKGLNQRDFALPEKLSYTPTRKMSRVRLGACRISMACLKECPSGPDDEHPARNSTHPRGAFLDSGPNFRHGRASYRAPLGMEQKLKFRF